MADYVLLMIPAAMIGGLIYFAWLAARQQRQRDGRPAGLGGWLVLVGVTTAILPLYLLAPIFRYWEMLQVMPEDDPFRVPILIAFSVVVAFEAFSFYVLTTFLGQKRSFPKLFIIINLTFVTIGIMSLAIKSIYRNYPPDWMELTGIALSIIISIVFILYTLRSERVNNTFS